MNQNVPQVNIIIVVEERKKYKNKDSKFYNPFSVRWKYKDLITNYYRIEQVSHFEHRIWKVKHVH